VLSRVTSITTIIVSSRYTFVGYKTYIKRLIQLYVSDNMNMITQILRSTNEYIFVRSTCVCRLYNKTSGERNSLENYDLS